MNATYGTRFGRKLTTWQRAQVWKHRQRQLNQRFRDEHTALSSAFATAQSNLVKGSADLAVEAGIKRVKAATQAKVQEAASVDISV